MPRHLHLDFESFSEADLTEVGSYRYAFDPTTEIMCAAMAINDEYPVIWHEDIRPGLASAFDPYWDALEDPEVLIYAHNAQFEMAMCQALLWKTWGIEPPALSRFRCTASMARRAALPGGLDKLSEVLDLKNKKDKRGKDLIKKFSMLQPAKKPTKKNPHGLPVRRIYPRDEPEAFREFMEYCQQDVRAEQEIAHRLAYFDEPINNRNYTMDAYINARGVPVNLVALRHAQRIIEEETEMVGARFRELTGFEITQGKVFLEWLHDEGCHLDNLQAETIETYLQEWEDVEVNTLEHPAVVALRMKQATSFASIKKVATMLACAGPHDNRIRGMLGHHGATTGRWTNHLVQFHNMKRPAAHMAKEPVKGTTWSEYAYREICAGVSRIELELFYGAPLDVISSCIRHFVHDVRCNCGGNNCDVPFFECGESPMLDADYSAIEARIVCWLAGEEWALDEYRAQDAATTDEDKERLDRYRIMASIIFSVPVDEVNKHPQRFIGKQAILLCGFQGGAPKFRQTCEKFGYNDMPAGLEDTAVGAFRKKHKAVVRYWTDVDKAAKRAIANPGNVVRLKPSDNAPEVQFSVKELGGMPFLLIRLPSGRKLAYPRPRVRPSSKFEGATEIVFFGKIGQTANWGDVSTYGGKLVENITQAVANDIMFNGLHNAESAGYETASIIHDEALDYLKPGQTPEEFVALLTDLPAWADGLPIAAEGDLVPFYKKG